MKRADDDSCDFLAYLEWRLGKDRNATAEILADWLATYQPLRPRSGGPALSAAPVASRLHADE